MLKFVFIFIALLLLVLFYRHLLQQSKQPSGFIGVLMMRLWNRVYLPLVAWSVHLLPTQKYQRILDVGVGNGVSTDYLQEKFPASEVWGIDISPEAIAQARKNSRYPTINFETKDVTNLGLPTEKFDLICAFQNHFHWDNLDLGLLELKRVLTPDGKIILACETTKVNYYLPDLKNLAAFKERLAPLGLYLKHSQQQRGWVYYELASKVTA